MRNICPFGAYYNSTHANAKTKSDDLLPSERQKGRRYIFVISKVLFKRARNAQRKPMVLPTRSAITQVFVTNPL